MYLLDKFCQVINTFANLQNKFRITIFFAKNLKISNEKRSKRYIIYIIKAENTCCALRK